MGGALEKGDLSARAPQGVEPGERRGEGDPQRPGPSEAAAGKASKVELGPARSEDQRDKPRVCVQFSVPNSRGPKATSLIASMAPFVKSQATRPSAQV